MLGYKQQLLLFTRWPLCVLFLAVHTSPSTQQSVCWASIMMLYCQSNPDSSRMLPAGRSGLQLLNRCVHVPTAMCGKLVWTAAAPLDMPCGCLASF